ncbi:MAG: transporter substrate-binding domain-containing protein [Synergistaceae bacterium]|nr:transporter substrate-binding domain-containing protein [Synergistaceae bacterium]
MGKTLRLVVLSALILVFGPFGRSGEGNDGDRVIRVGTDSGYPPYVFEDPSGTFRGFEVDLVEALAEKTGLSVEWVDYPFADLIAALREGAIDAIAAAMSVTRERARVVAFTEAYEISLSTLVVRSGRKDVKALADLAGKRVAALRGSVQEAFLGSLRAVGAVEALETVEDCLEAVRRGEVDGAFMDRPVAVHYVGGKAFAGELAPAFNMEIAGSAKALAVRREDEALLGALNKALAELKSEGGLAALRDRWMPLR